MNPAKTVCPNCQAKVVFIHLNGTPQCPECGAMLGRVSKPSGLGAGAMSLFKAFTWLLVAVLAVAGIAAAVVFVGCALSCGHL